MLVIVMVVHCVFGVVQNKLFMYF